jgi:hypothetical protein
MSRIGHASAAAAIRYQHVIDGQDADIVDYLERFDLTPPGRPSDRGDTPVPDVGGHVEGTATPQPTTPDGTERPDLGVPSGDDGTRTHDPLLAKQVL